MPRLAPNKQTAYRASLRGTCGPGRCAGRAPWRSRAGIAFAIALGAATVLARGAGGQQLLYVTYPRSESGSDERTDYPLAVLRIALEHSGRPFRLQPSSTQMQQSRSLRELAAGNLDVVWSVATAEREAGLRAVPFPIDRGLIGWRVLLVRRGDGARFTAIASASELARVNGAQGHDWPDLAVLLHNGLRVMPSPTYEGLFSMLARGHVDYVARSISEAGAELGRHADLPLEIGPHLLLYYPSALYFFVQPRNQDLAAAIGSGLESSLRDGSLGARFDAQYSSCLAALGRRRVIRLDNPDLPPDAPVSRRELWLEPEDAP